MMIEDGRPSGHEKFEEFGALANANALTRSEWTELQDHLQTCEPCRKIYHEYRILVREGLPGAVRDIHSSDQRDWNDTATRQKLLTRLRVSTELSPSKSGDRLPVTRRSNFFARIPAGSLSLAKAALVACLVLTSVGVVAYRLGSREHVTVRNDRSSVSVEDPLQKLAVEKKSVEELLDAQMKNAAELQETILQKEHDMAKLGSALRAAEDRANELASAKTSSEAPSQMVSAERDTLNSQLRDAQLSYQNAQTELAGLRAERDKALQQNASLESTIAGLTATNRDREQRVLDDEQYLASDRDIRELMGARNLYIADVFDVDSRSRTRKPFGRIFYTQGKSLLFYAFDLNDQPEFKNADTFQAWGRSDADKGKPLNLGIFYMDSETNRRWVLRFDDAKKVTDINAVFVTVEPHGGSRKPTGKPFLYALLRKESNHP
jgi:anti-sigma-K factor RskA